MERCAFYVGDPELNSSAIDRVKRKQLAVGLPCGFHVAMASCQSPIARMKGLVAATPQSFSAAATGLHKWRPVSTALLRWANAR